MDARTAVTVPRYLPWRTPWSIVERLEAPVEAIGFWAAMGLPVYYLSLLVRGIDSRVGLVIFLSLLGLHVIALVIGHDHQPGRIRRGGTGH